MRIDSYVRWLGKWEKGVWEKGDGCPPKSDFVNPGEKTRNVRAGSSRLPCPLFPLPERLSGATPGAPGSGLRPRPC